MTLFAILVNILGTSSAAVDQEVTSGKVYRSVDGKRELIFTYERKQKGDTVTQVYRQSDGLPASTEVLTLENGKLKNYTFEDHRLLEKGVLDIASGEGNKRIARFVYTKKDRTDADTEILDKDVTAGPVMLQTVLDHFDEILTGGEFGVRLAVLDRRETVGFKFNFDSRFEADGKSVIRIRCSASSFIIRLIAPKILFDFDAKTRKLLRVQGPTLLKVKDGNSWKQMDAETIVD